MFPALAKLRVGRKALLWRACEMSLEDGFAKAYRFILQQAAKN
jgi:hypothetical protein